MIYSESIDYICLHKFYEGFMQLNTAYKPHQNAL